MLSLEPDGLKPLKAIPQLLGIDVVIPNHAWVNAQLGFLRSYFNPGSGQCTTWVTPNFLQLPKLDAVTPSGYSE